LDNGQTQDSHRLRIVAPRLFPNGSTLQIGGMAGNGFAAYRGFDDKVKQSLSEDLRLRDAHCHDRNEFDMALPESTTLSTQDTASDAARRNLSIFIPPLPL